MHPSPPVMYVRTFSGCPTFRQRDGDARNRFTDLVDHRDRRGSQPELDWDAVRLDDGVDDLRHVERLGRHLDAHTHVGLSGSAASQALAVWSSPTQLAVVRTAKAGSVPTGPPSVSPIVMAEVPSARRCSIWDRAMVAARTRSEFSRIVLSPLMRMVMVAVEITTNTSIATITSTMVKPSSGRAVPGRAKAGRRNRLSLHMAHPTTRSTRRTVVTARLSQEFRTDCPRTEPSSPTSLRVKRPRRSIGVRRSSASSASWASCRPCPPCPPGRTLRRVEPADDLLARRRDDPPDAEEVRRVDAGEGGDMGDAAAGVGVHHHRLPALLHRAEVHHDMPVGADLAGGAGVVEGEVAGTDVLGVDHGVVRVQRRTVPRNHVAGRRRPAVSCRPQPRALRIGTGHERRAVEAPCLEPTDSLARVRRADSDERPLDGEGRLRTRRGADSERAAA